MQIQLRCVSLMFQPDFLRFSLNIHLWDNAWSNATTPLQLNTLLMSPGKTDIVRSVIWCLPSTAGSCSSDSEEGSLTLDSHGPSNHCCALLAKDARLERTAFISGEWLVLLGYRNESSVTTGR